MLADAGQDLEQLGQRIGAILATSAPANGLFAGLPYALGISGGFASPFAADLLPQADLVLVFGASINHWTTKHGALISGDANLVQVDIDASAIGRNRPADLAIIGDAKTTAAALTKALEHVRGDLMPCRHRFSKLLLRQRPRLGRDDLDQTHERWLGAQRFDRAVCCTVTQVLIKYTQPSILAATAAFCTCWRTGAQFQMSVPLRIGVMQLTMEPLEEILGHARALDRHGFDTIWLAEAYPWWRKHQMEARSSTVLSALIARDTEQLTIGWGIISPFTRHPIQVAMDARVTQELAGPIVSASVSARAGSS